MNVLVCLVLLPLGASIALALSEAEHRPSAAVASCIALCCLISAWIIPAGEGRALGLLWEWQPPDAWLAMILYGAVLLLSVLAWIGPADGIPGHAALGLAALLTLAVTFQDRAQALLIVPLALTGLASCGTESVGVQGRGRAQFLAQAGLSMPIAAGLLVAWPKTTGLPGQAPLVFGASWLIFLLAMLWLGTFPFDGSVRLLTRDQPAVGVPILWAAKDVAIGCVVLTLWQAYPELRTDSVGVALAAVGLCVCKIDQQQ